MMRYLYHLQRLLIREKFLKISPGSDYIKIINDFDQKRFDSLQINNAIILMCRQILVGGRVQVQKF